MRSRNSTTVTSAPSRRQTEPSSRPMMPAPITTRRLGDLRQRQRAGGIDDPLLVDARRPAGGAGSEPVAMTMFLASRVVSDAVRGRDLDLAGAGDAARALDPVDLVLLEQELDALGQGGRPLSSFCFIICGRLSLGVDVDAEAGEVLGRHLVQLRGVQQRLGRHAADVQAGAAQRRRASRRRRPSGRAGRRGSRRCSRRGRRR